MSLDRGRALVILGEVNPAATGGASRSWLGAAPALAARGWELHYWTNLPSATAEVLTRDGASVAGARRDLKYSPAQLLQPPGPRVRIAGSVAGLRAFGRHLEAIDPDLVVANTVGTLPELVIARRRGFPTLLHVLEELPPTRRHRAGLRMLSRLSTAVMVPSAATAAQFEAIGRKAAVIHTGIEPPPGVRGRTAQGRTPVAGALGTISKRKGTDVMVAAAGVLRERGVAVDLRLAGAPIEGVEAASAQGIVRQASAAGIEARGWVDPWVELPTWDILILPSREDPFPNAVLEAMSLGLPVIASAVGGVPEQLGAEAGLLVAPGDPVELADAITALAADPARRRRLGDAGRRRVAKLFSLEAQADATATMMREVAAMPRP